MIASSLLTLGFLLSSVRGAPAPGLHKRAIIETCIHDFAYTFDDGPYNSHKHVSDVFTGLNSKATFFINGDNYKCIYDTDMVAAIKYSYAAGHQLASHTWSHADLTTLSNAQIDVEIQRLDDAFIKILGVKPLILRPPYGAITPSIASYIESKHGKKVVLWSDDSGDSDGGATTKKSVTFYQNLAKENPRKPHMSLSHETYTWSISALDQGTASGLVNAGIKLITVADCLNTPAYQVVGAPQAKDSTWTCSGTWTPPKTSTTATTGTKTSTSTTTPNTSSTPTTPKASTSTTTTSSAPTSTGTGAFVCTKNYTIKSGDICYNIAANNGVPLATFQSYNPGINCNNLQIGQVVCVAGHK